MKQFRTILFWLHLACGVAAGIVVLIMCVTGVALTYEKQVIEWGDRRAAHAAAPAAWSALPSGQANRIPPETLLARVREARPGVAPTTLVYKADPAMPALVTLQGNALVLVHPDTGQFLGVAPTGLRTFFRTMMNWHRWLALEGASRATGRLLTGIGNAVFLFIVLSGVYLWLPRVWTWLQVRRVLWFRPGLAAKARDFNWHNVIGIWSAVPLAIVVATAMPISFVWTRNLVYALNGEVPPTPAVPAAAPAPVAVSLVGLNAAYALALTQGEWRALTLRIPANAGAPVTVALDRGHAGQPQLRQTITVRRTDGQPQRVEAFADLSAARQWLSWARFAHTGEYYGLAGQTVAGLASAGGVVLVYTGLALALRRCLAWIKRRRPDVTVEASRAA